MEYVTKVASRKVALYPHLLGINHTPTAYRSMYAECKTCMLVSKYIYAEIHAKFVAYVQAVSEKVII